jgi:predicted AlkP superfamily phosphohydrolase/phosphomutase
MSEAPAGKPSRRTFLKRGALAAAGAAAVGAGGYWLGSRRRVSRAGGKKVIVIGIDGMDPRLCEAMMKEGQLPHLARLRAAGGFSELGTSVPPQSPVAWANFINGAGPGSHGIFDFIHRDPREGLKTSYSASEIVPGHGGWEVGEHRLPLELWPFNHKSPTPVLKRQGEPFWDFLDAAGVPTTFYDLPSNYPPSPSGHGYHRCICGMGTPDMLGEYSVYQHFTDAAPTKDDAAERVGKQSRLTFEAETARAELAGPQHSFLKSPRPVNVPFLVHRDRKANAAVIDLQGQRLLLKAGEWSGWTKVTFEMSMPWFLPDEKPTGICRFYLQEVSPTFRLYVTPINMDPRGPVLKLSEPPSFIKDVAKKVGPFYTTGFKEDYSARVDGVFVDDEYRRQADMVLQERLALFEAALEDYDDGLLFFYFSSSDLQSHIFWWDSDEPHPGGRTPREAEKGFGLVKQLYRRLDRVVGDLLDRYGSSATLIVMSDHGFANFGRQFALNSWLRNHGYLDPQCSSIRQGIDWSLTKAYGLGINGLYLNLKGREPHGIVEPGAQAEELVALLKERLEKEATDENGEPAISTVYRADQVYSGPAMALAPDLIVGYRRGFRASWATVTGGVDPVDTQGMTLEEQGIILPNKRAWSADHCADALEVPGVLFCNRPFRAAGASLVDLAPSILAEFGVHAPGCMAGKSLFPK